jgi:hypothetical protein
MHSVIVLATDKRTWQKQQMHLLIRLRNAPKVEGNWTLKREEQLDKKKAETHLLLTKLE